MRAIIAHSMNKRNIIFALLITIALAVATAIIDATDFRSWLVFVSVAAAVWSAFLYGEGKWYAFVFEIVSYGMYIYFCIVMLFYGELALSVIVIIVSVVSLIKWKKNTNDEKRVVAQRLSVKELLLVAAACVIGSLLLWWLFYVVDGGLPLLNGMGVMLLLAGMYLAYRISKWQFIPQIFYGLVLVALWVISAVQGAPLGFALFAVGGVIDIVLYSLAFRKWHNKAKAEGTPPPPKQKTQ